MWPHLRSNDYLCWLHVYFHDVHEKETSPEMSGDVALGRFKRVIARGAFPLHLEDKYETQDCAHTYRQAWLWYSHPKCPSINSSICFETVSRGGGASVMFGKSDGCTGRRVKGGREVGAVKTGHFKGSYWCVCTINLIKRSHGDIIHWFMSTVFFWSQEWTCRDERMRG